MHYNKLELVSLATQPSGKYEKEGLLYVFERQDGFFRKSESNIERWCRLRGNLLFYFKGKDPWSELYGVLVLEYCQIVTDSSVVLQHGQIEGCFPFHIIFEDGVCQTLASSSSAERLAWISSMKASSYLCFQEEIKNLLEQIDLKPSYGDILAWRKKNSLVPEVPLCEVTLRCDNLLCDGHGKPPNPMMLIEVYMSSDQCWVQYSHTEVIEQNSNPIFLKSITFRASDGLNEHSLVRIKVVNVIEVMSNTFVTLGSTCILLSTIKKCVHLRFPLISANNQSVGFITIHSWQVEPEEKHSPVFNKSVRTIPCKTLQVSHHRRSQSLPVKFRMRLRTPLHSQLKHLFLNPVIETYLFHSGLGGDIRAYEYMLESNICFTFPQHLLDVWIYQEKCLLEAIIGLGELREPWYTRQAELINRHLHLLRSYCQAKNNLRQLSGQYFKPSTRKADEKYEFAPTNLHLQQLWIHSNTLDKENLYDWITVGAFTAHSHKTHTGGLIRLVQQLKESPIKSSTSYQISVKISMANDAIHAIKQLRREIIEDMDVLMKAAHKKQTFGMLTICDDMIKKTRILLSLWDPALVEEAFHFLEGYKVCTVEKDSTEKENYIKPSVIPPCFNYVISHLTSLNLDKSYIDNSPSPCAIKSIADLLEVRKELTLDKSTLNTNIQNSHKEYLNNSTENESPTTSWVNCDETDSSFLSNPLMENSYKPTDEPEPWDIIQLNIEASIMCLVSKVKFLCGRNGSPAVRLKQSNLKNTIQTNLNNARHTPSRSKTETNKSKICNKFTEGLDLNKITDWTAELRPSMKKLRQAMDGLLKTARLTHSVFRLQQNPKSAQKSCNIQYRRDVCFSQALTSLVIGLLGKIWQDKPDPVFIKTLNLLGPLASFHCLLSYFGNEIDMWGDMAVAVEDLRTVLFTLQLCDECNGNSQVSPKICGNRDSLTVILPVPNRFYILMPSKYLSFHVTPVFFNIGINEMATLAESAGTCRLQSQSNADNFTILNEYYLRHKKLNICDSYSDDRLYGCSYQDTVNQLVNDLKNVVQSDKPKNVDVLHVSSKISRLLKGLQFVSCKSAKDRTGMFTTLEECQILLDDYELVEHEFQSALDCMRRVGTRRTNTWKNINVKKYAFTSIQVMALPRLYRPPVGTYGSSET